MAVAYDTSLDAIATSASSVGVTFTIGANSNRCLYGLVGAGSTTSKTLTSLTWGADALSEISDSFGNEYLAAAGRLLAPAAESRTLTATISASADSVYVCGLSLYNVDQTTPEGSVLTNTDSTGTDFGVACGGVADGLAVGLGAHVGTSITPMAGYPWYAAVGTASTSAGATSTAPAAPSGGLRGDLDFASVATENNETISCSGTGWVKVGSTVQQDSTWQEDMWVRQHDGSNINPTFSWTSSVGCNSRRWLLRDANVSDFLGFDASNSGSGATHSTTGQNTTADKSRVMYVDHAEANTALATPSGWTENFDAGSATGPYRLAVGGKNVSTSGSGSGNISVTGAAASWVQRQIEILAAVAQTQRQEAENSGAGPDNYSVDTEPGATYNTFGWTGSTSDVWRALAFCVNPASGGGVSGTISVTLSSFVSSIASTKTHVGTIGVTLASFISSIAGKSTHVGTIGVALSNFISTITGSKTHVGSISQTLSNFVSAITGGSSVSGTIAAMLSNFVSSISGKIGKVGTIASTLSNFISNISGTVSGGTGVASWLVHQIGNKLKFASRYLTTSIRRNRNNG